MALQFLDEAGNALPAGVRVTVYQPNGNVPGAIAPPPLGAFIGQAFTTPGGLCNINVMQSVPYIALFDMSSQAPTSIPGFSGSGAGSGFAGFSGGTGTTVVTLSGYRSPTLSTAGYAQLQTALWPKGWFADTARRPGGNAYGVGVLVGAMIAQVDSFFEVVHGALRLPSCVGPQVDSWARDFFGPYLPRYQGESDAVYVSRIYTALQLPKTTLQEIQAMVQGFYMAIAQELGYGMGGGQTLDLTGALDVQGGADISGPFQPSQLSPTVYVWDRQSRPDLANQYNINQHNNDGSFVIQVGLAFASGWNLDYSYLDYNAWLINPNQYTLSNSPPDPRLGALVAFCKAGGAWPRYLTADLTGG
jgi:hypothetical protein